MGGGGGGVFFFQAGDGIRDLVRSRGLGDVYKRQDTDSDSDGTPDCVDACPADFNKTLPGQDGCGVLDLSLIHILTLPTIYSV